VKIALKSSPKVYERPSQCSHCYSNPTFLPL
jgi:predicted Na+-dependent transporter